MTIFPYKKFIIMALLVAFLANTFGPMPLYAQDLVLPKPGVMVHLSPPMNPPILKGLKIDKNNPFKFDFILDTGDVSTVGTHSNASLQEESTKLIKYFLASLTTPEKDLWVNLSPYEKNRIIPNSFGLTEMGRDLLAQDYMLKQITASLIYPEDEIGKKFWKRIYEEAAKKYNTTNIPVNTFNKVWIVPEKAVVYENAKAGTAYVVESKLKVMLEEDYLSLEKNGGRAGDMALAVSPSTLPSELPMNAKATQRNKPNAIGTQIIREIVIPELTREINEGQNFSRLRQVYHSLILAAWYKRKIKDSLLAQIYTDKNKIKGINFSGPKDIEKIYQQYLQAFKKGVYNYIKEEADLLSKQPVSRKYFSGGIQVQALFGEGMDSAMNIVSDESALPADITRPQLVVESQIVLPEDSIKQKFIDEVILSVMGRDQLPPEVQLSSGHDEAGFLYVTFEHTQKEPFSGKEVRFRYKIVLTDDKFIHTPEIVSLDDENVMEIPKPSVYAWDDEFIQSMRYGLRRLMVADPLNGRFSGKYTLDPYQKEAIAAILAKLDQESKALAVMATATGKTVVAFESMNAHMDKLKAKGQEPGAVLFIVNNNKILSEAEEKLQAMFPGKYKTSQVYEGRSDYSGDVIFATARSLASSNRVLELLNTRKVSLVIFDEVHHLPAEEIRSVYRQIDEESIHKQSDTKFLGLTATEVRPDRVSVIALFERSIVYEYPISRAKQEGSLVPIQYINVDKGYPAEQGDLNPILSSDPRWPEFSDWRYSEERYPDLLAFYQEHAQDLLDKRGLIIAPDVASAQRLAAYFRKQGVAAVSLTGADRNNNAKAFEDNYQAWKNGQWQKGSVQEQEGQAVPQVVVAVDIFKEGVDVPAINLVMLWADTNSSIEFIQSIGRGLRLAPFKTKLIVLDAVGLYRKWYLLNALVSQAGTLKPEDEFEIVLRKGNQADKTGNPVALFEGSKDVSEKLTTFLNDIPDRLAFRYGSYLNIPVDQLVGLLDPWMAYRADFIHKDAMGPQIEEGKEKFYQHIADFAQKLYSGHASIEEKKDFRRLFSKSFDSVSKTFQEALDIPIESEMLKNRITYLRVLELLNKGRAEAELLSPDLLDDVFPEFSESQRIKIQNRSKNLKQLRMKVFKKDPLEFTRELYFGVFKNPHLDKRIFEDKEIVQLSFQMKYAFEDNDEVRQKDMVTEMKFAEGGINHNNEEFKDVVLLFVQKAIIDICTFHPRLKGLTYSDFEVPPEEFKSRLEHLSLTQSMLETPQVLKRIKLLSQNYQASLEPENETKISRDLVGKQLLTMLNNETYRLYFSAENMDQETAQSLLSMYAAIKSVLASLADKANKQDRDILDSATELMKLGKLLWEKEIQGLPGVKFMVEGWWENPTITLQSNNPNMPKIENGRGFRLNIEADALETRYVLVEQSSYHAFNYFYGALNTVDKDSFLNGYLELIDEFSSLLGSPLTIMVAGKEINRDLFEHILAVTNYNVMGIFNSLSGEGMDFSFGGLSRSRMEQLNSDYYARIYAKKTKPGTFNWRLRYVLKVLHDYYNQLLPLWGVLEKKLQTPFEDPLVERARRQLLEILTNQINKDVTGPDRMTYISMVYKMLGGENPTPPSAQEILRAYVFLKFQFNHIFIENNFKPSIDVVTRMGSLYVRSFEHGISVDPDLDKEINDLIKSFASKIDVSSRVVNFFSSLQSIVSAKELIKKISAANQAIFTQLAVKRKALPVPALPSIEANNANANTGSLPVTDNGLQDIAGLAPFFGKDDAADPESRLKMMVAVWNGALVTDELGGTKRIPRLLDWDIQRAKRNWPSSEIVIVPAMGFYDPIQRKQLRQFETVEGTPSPEQWEAMEKLRQEAKKYAKGHDVDEQGDLIKDNAQLNSLGGIDLDINKVNLHIQNSGSSIAFNFDPAMLHQFQNASGFTPVIMGIKPLSDLKIFLGLTPGKLSKNRI